MNLPYRRDFRDRGNYIAAVASEFAAPLLRRWGRSVSRGDPTPPETWRTGLIVGNGHIGDVLYRTCSLDALAQGLPRCRWSYLTTELGADVLRANPAVYDVLPWMSNASPSSTGDTYVQALRTREYDVVLCTESIQHHTALRLALRLGTPNRVAFGHKGLSGLITYPIHLQSPMSRPAQFRAMVTSITGATNTQLTGPLRPRVYPSDADRRAAATEWARLGFGEGTPVLACSLTTRQRIGKTPPEFFIDVLRAVAAQSSDIRIVLCGTLEDGQVLRSAADAIGPRALLSVGALSVLGYAAFLERCRALFGSDSGPRHLANAANIPVVFVRNLATSAVEAGKYCATERDAAPDGEYLDDARITDLLSRIDREAVAKHIIALAFGGPAES